MTTDFTDTVPPAAGHRYNIALTLVEFPQSGKVNPDDPNLTWAPLPFIQTIAANGPYRAQGQFLLDSGAQMSIISTKTAITLGLDTNRNGVIDFDTEAIRTEEIGGVGGSLIVPVVSIDRISLPTAAGIALTWTDASAIVIDVADIPGILGMDLFTSGWLEALFGGDPGYLDKIHLDFRHTDVLLAAMHIDVNPLYDHRALGAPQYAAYDLFDFALFASHWLTQNCTPASSQGADLNADTHVDALDLAILADRWLAPAAAPPAPSFDLHDFALFTAQWLDSDCQTPTWCNAADRTRDGQVDTQDLADFLNHWLTPSN
jgi:hypothetical protein